MELLPWMDAMIGFGSGLFVGILWCAGCRLVSRLRRYR